MDEKYFCSLYNLFCRCRLPGIVGLEKCDRGKLHMENNVDAKFYSVIFLEIFSKNLLSTTVIPL